MNKDTPGRYRLLERIGAGGMGEVWKAHDGRLDRIVAVKRLLRSALSNDAGHERFRREALTLSRLSHAGIATVFASTLKRYFMTSSMRPDGTNTPPSGAGTRSTNTRSLVLFRNPLPS